MDKTDSLNPLTVLAAGMAILIGMPIISVTAFGNPTEDVAERVDAQVERVTEISVEQTATRAVERAEELAAQRAVDRAEDLVAEKLLNAVAEILADIPTAGGEETGEEKAHRALHLSRGADSHVFRLARDERGQEIVRSEGLIMVDGPRLAELLEDGLSVIETRKLDGLDTILVRFEVPERTSAENVLSALSAASGDLTTDYNHVYRPDTADARSASRRSYKPAEFYDLSAAKRDTATAIGLIDSALSESHEALKGAKIIKRDFVDYANERPRAHGTAIASVLVGQSAQYRGIMPHADLYAASVFLNDASGHEAATTMSLVRAVDWLVSEGVPVINISMTGPPNRILERTIERASRQGILIVAAVGNDGPAAPPAFPAAYEEVVAITAIDRNRTIYRLANRGPHLDFSAPGVDILCASDDGGYVSRTGTSMAAPFAAAIFAEALSRNIEPREVLRDVRRRAEDLGETGFDPVYGHGLIRRFPGS